MKKLAPNISFKLDLSDLKPKDLTFDIDFIEKKKPKVVNLKKIKKGLF